MATVRRATVRIIEVASRPVAVRKAETNRNKMKVARKVVHHARNSRVATVCSNKQVVNHSNRVAHHARSSRVATNRNKMRKAVRSKVVIGNNARKATARNKVEVIARHKMPARNNRETTRHRVETIPARRVRKVTGHKALSHLSRVAAARSNSLHSHKARLKIYNKRLPIGNLFTL